ncbi:hypothetical protein GJ496_006078 [Pomphorhynchus laevis]|nr:hypothetical protein GJ496_006078 [Pomphorhynchus laevis]
MNWFDSHLIPDKSVQIIYLPAQHNSVRNLIDFCKTLWGGWAICTNEFRFYFAGDTAYNALMFQTIGRLVGPFDLAAIPIGAYEPRNILRMNHICPEEAVQVHKDIGSKKSFGIHWGTFPLSDENFDDPCKDLATALDNLSCEPNEFVTLKIGQILRF